MNKIDVSKDLLGINFQQVFFADIKNDFCHPVKLSFFTTADPAALLSYD